MADTVLAKLTLGEVERELAARRRELAALSGIRAALKRKAVLEDVDRRLREQHQQAEAPQS